MSFDDVAFLLGEQGPFASKNSKFDRRESQQQMASEISAMIQHKGTLVAESGTGTGKTYAYLVPTMISGKKTLISTGTKHLQEQLFHRDIPTVMKTLEISCTSALLKGRSNYLCLERLKQTRSSGRKLDKKMSNDIEQISSWSGKTASGDIAECDLVAEDSKVWPLVTSTVDNCLGSKCQFFEDCHVNLARKRAQKSDIVVINHHLYFADKALKEDGFGKLLPDFDTVVFDEAHQIPDIASVFLGKNFSSWQVSELVKDVRLAELAEKSLVSGLLQYGDTLEKSIADYRLSLGINERKLSWHELQAEVPQFLNNLQKLGQQLADFADLLEKAAPAGEAMMRCYERALSLSAHCAEISDDADTDNNIRWLEVLKRTFRINETPLHIGQELDSFFGNRDQARIFTSATLSIENDFSHYLQIMGLGEVDTKCWDSQFDFYNQAVLYVPEGLPEPRAEEFANDLVEAVLPLLKASRGRAFMLFTSFRVMHAAEQLLESKGFNVLVQGSKNKADLLKLFREKDNAVLLGTMSFWEGVDVQGDDLSCVIIDKLPFESPYEPVMKARLKDIEESGGNPFFEYQIPRAVITLRQGAGRLIRSQQDKGVLVICDSRLRGSRYGKIFLESLPPMRRTHDQQKVVRFLEHC